MVIYTSKPINYIIRVQECWTAAQQSECFAPDPILLYTVGGCASTLWMCIDKVCQAGALLTVANVIRTGFLQNFI